jgi:hypothetical protein
MTAWLIIGPIDFIHVQSTYILKYKPMTRESERILSVLRHSEVPRQGTRLHCPIVRVTMHVARDTPDSPVFRIRIVGLLQESHHLSLEFVDL